MGENHVSVYDNGGIHNCYVKGKYELKSFYTNWSKFDKKLKQEFFEYLI